MKEVLVTAVPAKVLVKEILVIVLSANIRSEIKCNNLVHAAHTVDGQQKPTLENGCVQLDRRAFDRF